MPFRSAIATISFAAWLASEGCSTVEEWIARSEAMSSSAICDGPSSPIDTPACEPTSLMSARLMAAMRMKSYAREKNAENVDTNGFQRPPDLHADGRRHELLLGDEHLEVAVRVRLAEVLRVRRVGDLAVERDHVRRRIVAERGQHLAVGLARGDRLAELPGRDARRRGCRTCRLARLGQGDLDREVALAAELLDRRVGIVERLAVLAGQVLDRLDALALLRAGDDRGRLALGLLGLGVGGLDLRRRRGRRSRSRSSRRRGCARRSRPGPSRASSRGSGRGG